MHSSRFRRCLARITELSVVMRIGNAPIFAMIIGDSRWTLYAKIARCVLRLLVSRIIFRVDVFKPKRTNRSHLRDVLA
jgi:hypothetical protein